MYSPYVYSRHKRKHSKVWGGHSCPPHTGSSPRLAKSVFLLCRFSADGLTLVTRMGSRLGDTIHLLELLITGAFGSAIVLGRGCANRAHSMVPSKGALKTWLPKC